jgi:hypothetical protein
MSCEDQGYGLLSDGCRKCQTFDARGRVVRPQFIQVRTGAGVFWQCPRCHGSYGPVPPHEVEEFPELDEAARAFIRKKHREKPPENSPYSFRSDEWIANRVFMLARNAIAHVAITQAARDRIMLLSLQLDAAQTLLAKHGNHASNCAYFHFGYYRRLRLTCDCGWDEYVKGLK